MNAELRKPVVTPPPQTLDLDSCEVMRCPDCTDGFERGYDSKPCGTCNGARHINVSDFPGQLPDRIDGSARYWWLTLSVMS